MFIIYTCYFDDDGGDDVLGVDWLWTNYSQRWEYIQQ